jgi:hypothetical protein
MSFCAIEVEVKIRRMPTAELIFEDKQLLQDGSIIQMRIWRVPSPVSPGTHTFKYSLFYGRPGRLGVLFDNERGKGDHLPYRRSRKCLPVRNPREAD